MVSCRYLRNVNQQIDMLISLRYLQDNWFYLGNFMKIIVPESFRDRVIFKPVDITSKCVIIPNQSKELVIVPNNCRFEMD